MNPANSSEIAEREVTGNLAGGRDGRDEEKTIPSAALEVDDRASALAAGREESYYSDGDAGDDVLRVTNATPATAAGRWTREKCTYGSTANCDRCNICANLLQPVKNRLRVHRTITGKTNPRASPPK